MVHAKKIDVGTTLVVQVKIQVTSGHDANYNQRCNS